MPILSAPENMGKDGISYLLTDSIEVGPQNWTDHILDEFKQRRGYDPHPWLPALTGVVIKSTADTDRFLWDFRRTHRPITRGKSLRRNCRRPAQLTG